MPCHDYGPSSDDSDYQRSIAAHERAIMAERRSDKLANLLCGLCRRLEAVGQLDMLMEPALAAWWSEHKRLDEARKAREAAHAQNARDSVRWMEVKLGGKPGEEGKP